MMTWRMVFWVAAIFNWLVGAPLFLAPEPLLAMLEVTAPADLTFHRMAGLLIVCLGTVYAFTAEDLQRYRPLIWIAVAGKLGVVAIFTLAFMQGFAPPRAFGLALGDLAFGLAFLVFLLTYPKGRPQT